MENEVKCNFKAGTSMRGVTSATDVLMAMAKGEFNEKSYGKGDQGPPWPFLVFILVVIAAFAFAWRNRVSSYSKTNNVDAGPPCSCSARWIASTVVQLRRRRKLGWRWWRIFRRSSADSVGVASEVVEQEAHGDHQIAIHQDRVAT